MSSPWPKTHAIVSSCRVCRNYRAIEISRIWNLDDATPFADDDGCTAGYNTGRYAGGVVGWAHAWRQFENGARVRVCGDWRRRRPFLPRKAFLRLRFVKSTPQMWCYYIADNISMINYYKKLSHRCIFGYFFLSKPAPQLSQR